MNRSIAFWPASAQRVALLRASIPSGGNELHAFVDGQLVATALDDSLPCGKYGMGTNRAAATWQDFDVAQ